MDCSTVSSAASARVRAMADEAGVDFLAAPVSGNPHVVAEGAACIVASGPVEVFSRARPYLDVLAGVVVHAGPAERGWSSCATTWQFIAFFVCTFTRSAYCSKNPLHFVDCTNIVLRPVWR